ncbi:hypothetical protein RRG08_047020 [Elysia crispata]|uniref:Aminopeptidase NAALADL1 n=1 Tax=Elysia crispata TaxID=231223 RepID=A0AAE1E546_9GAST|nr:hypothetical protein RRG08_047020 [Elysia crispata]
MMRGFDSIESMNADSVLVKRQRGSKRYVVCAIIIGCAFFLVGILIGYFSRAQHQHSAPTPPPETLRLRPIDLILTSIKEEAIRDSLRQYTTESSVAGMPGTAKLAQKILTKWKGSGLDRVYISSHKVPLSLPNQSHPNKVEIIDSLTGEAVYAVQLEEPSLRPGETNIGGPPGLNPFSPAGEVNADVVYANYGRLEDFEFLKKKLSLDISGKIIIVRLGRIYAGNKVLNAQEFGAGAVILYPDPAEFSPPFQPHTDNEPVNPTNPSGPTNPSSSTADLYDNDNHEYPDGWWIPATGIRKEPLYVISREEKMPKIPCISISFEDAAHILRNLSGPVSPTSWHGGLYVDYKTGPGFQPNDNNTDLQVRVSVTNSVDKRPIHNVFGIITGSVEPDRYVIVGHHRDTISRGTVESHAGSVALDQLVATYGQLLQLGHRPLRTIIFCSWDGGVQGSLGSSAWLQDNFQLVSQRAVAYLNIGVMADGNFTLKAVASPLLQSSLYEAAKQIHSPDNKYESLYDLWADRPFSKLESSDKHGEPKVLYSADGIGDYSSFYYSAGVSIASITATFDREEFPTESYPLYHTAYDSVFAYENFCDPGYKFTKALTQMWGACILKLANTSTIPFQVSIYSKVLNHLVEKDLVHHKTEWSKHGIQIGDLVSAVSRFSNAAASFESRLASEKDLKNSLLKQRIYNDQLMAVERAFVDPTGLKQRPFLKHTLFGPSITDEASGTTFPGIQDALHKIDQGETAAWNDLMREIEKITAKTLMAAKLLEQSPQL